MSKKYYYHFTNGDKLRDGRPVPAVGKWLNHEGPLIPCDSGLHASEHPFDALTYAPGLRLHLVELGGKIEPHGSPVDKVCSRRRKIVKSIDATELVLGFARACALDAAKKHWPEAPAVVLEYLETGDESKREAAAARAAAWSTAWSAARAAQAAAQAAAWAAQAAAQAAAAWSAARAAQAAAQAARAAAQAARAEASEAASEAAWAAATEKYRSLFQSMVDEAFEQQK